MLVHVASSIFWYTSCEKRVLFILVNPFKKIIVENSQLFSLSRPPKPSKIQILEKDKTFRDSKPKNYTVEFKP